MAERPPLHLFSEEIERLGCRMASNLAMVTASSSSTLSAISLIFLDSTRQKRLCPADSADLFGKTKASPSSIENVLSSRFVSARGVVSRRKSLPYQSFSLIEPIHLKKHWIFLFNLAKFLLVNEQHPCVSPVDHWPCAFCLFRPGKGFLYGRFDAKQNGSGSFKETILEDGASHDRLDGAAGPL